MKNEHDKHPPDKAGRTLIKAFTFAGAILGVGAIGLARAAASLAEEMGWIARQPRLGMALWWILAGAGVGFLSGYLLVKIRRRS